MLIVTVLTVTFFYFLIGCGPSNHEQRQMSRRYHKGDFVYMKIDSTKCLVLESDAVLSDYQVSYVSKAGKHETEFINDIELW